MNIPSKDIGHIFANVPVGFCTFDEELRYTYINEWLAGRNSLPVSAHLGRTVFEALPSIAEKIGDRLREVLSKGVPAEGIAESATLPNDGKFYQYTFTPIVDDDGATAGVSCLVQDVTESHLARLELKSAYDDLADQVAKRRQSDERFAQLVETVPYGIEEIDTFGTIIYANRANHDRYGFETGELIGTNILDRAPNETERRELADYLEYLVTEQPEPTPYIGRESTKTGDVITVEVVWDYRRDDDGKLLGFISVISDISDRKKAEEQLQQRHTELEQEIREGQKVFADSSAYLQTIVAHIVDALISIDESGVIESFNPAAEAMFGYTAGEVIGQNVSMLMTEPDRQHHDGYIANYLERGSSDIIGSGSRQVIGRRKDGTDIVLELAVAQTEFAGRALFLGSLRDVTERHEAEELLRVSEQRMQDFATISADWFFEMDADLRFTYLTEANTIAGAGAEKFIGKTRQELMDKAFDPAAPDAEIIALQARKPYRGVIRRSDISPNQWLQVSGTPIYDASGEFAGFRGTSTNITELHNVEQANQQLLAAIDNLSEGLALFDKDDLLVVCNQRYGVLSGVDPRLLKPGTGFEDLLRQNVAAGNIAVAADDPENWIAARLAKRRTMPGTFEQSIGPYELIISEVRLPDGGTVQVLHDNTELKEREELFRQAQKMEAVGQLTGGVAHDFNNLLTIIMGNTALVRSKLGLDHELDRLIGPILRAAERGAELTHRMLAFSRNQPLKAELINVNNLLAAMNVLLLRSVTADVELSVKLSPDLWACMIDPVQFEQSVLNLAINAADAMPDGGRLEITTANMVTASGDNVPRLDLNPGDYVTVTVSDTGAGIAPEYIERIFDPFFTTKDIGRGTGLGLSMVYGWAKQSGGGVSVDSELGVGTTIRIYLPRVGQEPSSRGVDDSTDEVPIPTGGETILVVEDDAEVSALLTFMLEKAGYKLLSAGDGEDAVVKLDRNQQIDLLITDVMLPGSLNGRDVAEHALASHDDCKVLFISGYAPETIADRGRLPVGSHFINKPFEPNVLLGEVRKLLDAAKG
jgi:PAS domain S-box-containing protein